MCEVTAFEELNGGEERFFDPYQPFCNNDYSKLSAHVYELAQIGENMTKDEIIEFLGDLANKYGEYKCPHG